MHGDYTRKKLYQDIVIKMLKGKLFISNICALLLMTRSSGDSNSYNKF